MDEPPDVATLVAGLVAESESARKYAVFKLKGMLSDPSFADAFIQADGLPPLREAVLETSGNTQAYALGSLDALLELDMGWECCDEQVLEKVNIMKYRHIAHELTRVRRLSHSRFPIRLSTSFATLSRYSSSSFLGPLHLRNNKMTNRHSAFEPLDLRWTITRAFWSLWCSD